MSLSHDELKLDKDQSNPMNTMLFSFALVSGVNSFYTPPILIVLLRIPLQIKGFGICLVNHFNENAFHSFLHGKNWHETIGLVICFMKIEN